MRYEKDVVCSEKPVLERPRLNWEVNINFILGVRECDSMGLIAVTLDIRAAMNIPPAKIFFSTTWANISISKKTRVHGAGFRDICVSFFSLGTNSEVNRKQTESNTFHIYCLAHANLPLFFARSVLLFSSAGLA